MKVLVLSGIIVAMSLAFGSVLAEEDGAVTLSGHMMCAKCTLKVEGVAECQDVVVTKGEDEHDGHYWVVKNEIAEKAGKACMTKRPVTVTGTLTEQDGRSWITPTRIEYAD
jgi:hypothetical protein